MADVSLNPRSIIVLSSFAGDRELPSDRSAAGCRLPVSIGKINDLMTEFRPTVSYHVPNVLANDGTARVINLEFNAMSDFAITSMIKSDQALLQMDALGYKQTQLLSELHSPGSMMSLLDFLITRDLLSVARTAFDESPQQGLTDAVSFGKRIERELTLSDIVEFRLMVLDQERYEHIIELLKIYLSNAYSLGTDDIIRVIEFTEAICKRLAG